MDGPTLIPIDGQLFIKLLEAKLSPTASESQVLSPNQELRWPDGEFFAKLFPEPWLKGVMSLGVIGWQSLSFSLRYMLCHVQLALHAQLLKTSGQSDPELAAYRSRFSPLPLQQAAWEASFTQRFPHILLGFSPLGIHAFPYQTGLCRSNNSMQPLGCNKAGAPLFCEQHQAERFWVEPLSPSASRQAVMQAYYGSPASLAEYGEATLAKLWHNFFQSLASTKIPTTQQKQESLKRFGWQDLSSENWEDRARIKSRYYELAKQAHPDQGGSQEEFLALHQAYLFLLAHGKGS